MKSASDTFKHLPEIATAEALAYLQQELALAASQQNQPACQASLRFEKDSITGFMALGGKLPVLVSRPLSVQALYVGKPGQNEQKPLTTPTKMLAILRATNKKRCQFDPNRLPGRNLVNLTQANPTLMRTVQ